MRLAFGQGSVSFLLDDDGEQLARAWLDETFPGVVDRIHEAAEALYWQAVGRSPVKTGKLRASWSRQVLVAPDLSSVRARLSNDAPHGKYVVSPKLPGSGSAFVELARKPLAAEGARVVEDLRAVIERTLGS